ncbi:cortistatin [Monodelphis domestica]|uniref:Cortistatin n=1 Tax=Monodelphis domestica TaxID=13616 RepID=F7DI29_MONDO|nr:cortistatin [Monodelphis domestica]
MRSKKMHRSLPLCFLLLVSWAVATASLPLEDSFALKDSQPPKEMADGRKSDFLTFLSSLYAWTSHGGEVPLVGAEDMEFSKREERALPHHVPPRDKIPCKNFFWKTFSSC